MEESVQQSDLLHHRHYRPDGINRARAQPLPLGRYLRRSLVWQSYGVWVVDVSDISLVYRA